MSNVRDRRLSEEINVNSWLDRNAFRDLRSGLVLHGFLPIEDSSTSSFVSPGKTRKFVAKFSRGLFSV